MPSSRKCCIIGCKTSLKDKKRLYVIPATTDRRGRTDPLKSERRQRWLEAIRRCPSKLKHGRVCSDHFITTRPVDDYNHPDWVPSLASGYDTPGESPQLRLHAYFQIREEERKIIIRDYKTSSFRLKYVGIFRASSDEDLQQYGKLDCTNLSDTEELTDKEKHKKSETSYTYIEHNYSLKS